MFERVLMVCVGNICRSPMAEHLLQQQRPNLKVSSAGIGALVGCGADEKAIQIMDAQQIDIRKHKARQLDQVMVNSNDLILVMESFQLDDITTKYPFALGKVHLLGKWLTALEIKDPYQKSQFAFDDAFALIDTAVNTWIKKI
ncbi:Low molecular weight protein-tyrosine-phosphatase Wzb [uncultured Candidatus Thioglobus sp.]|nr:Low molecular weight protein-tyrosine-phosphatase Wzb [uncultured Candidatus Thioglobus sp.]SMN00658.1 Low molecular weight protein-tyrosine-phosphatase Wzb [uncultured Candidatus Thioglobus sp.]